MITKKNTENINSVKLKTATYIFSKLTKNSEQILNAPDWLI